MTSTRGASARWCTHEAAHLRHFALEEDKNWNTETYLKAQGTKAGETDRATFVEQVAAGKTPFSKQWLDKMQGIGSWLGYPEYHKRASNKGTQWGTPWSGFVRHYSTANLAEDVATTVEEVTSNGCKGADAVANLDHTQEPLITDPKVEERARARLGAKLKMLLDNGFLCKDQLTKNCNFDLVCDAKGDCTLTPRAAPLDCPAYTKAIKDTSASTGTTADDVNKVKNSTASALGKQLKSGKLSAAQLKQKCNIDTEPQVKFYSTMGGPKSCCEEGWWQQQTYCGTNPAKGSGYTFSISGAAGCMDTYRDGL